VQFPLSTGDAFVNALIPGELVHSGLWNLVSRYRSDCVNCCIVWIIMLCELYLNFLNHLAWLTSVMDGQMDRQCGTSVRCSVKSVEKLRWRQCCEASLQHHEVGAVMANIGNHGTRLWHKSSWNHAHEAVELSVNKSYVTGFCTYWTAAFFNWLTSWKTGHWLLWSTTLL